MFIVNAAPGAMLVQTPGGCQEEERPPLWPLTLEGRPMRGRGTASPSLLPPLLPHLRLPPTCKRRCYQMASPPSASKGTLLESLISDGSSLPPGGVAPTLIAGGGVTSRSGRCIHGCQFTTSYTCRFPLPELMMLILLQ